MGTTKGRKAARARGWVSQRFLTDVMVGGALMAMLHLFVVQISVVKGHSMEPCLHDGDRLVVDRISYSVMDVDRYDVVVLRYPLNPDIDFVKRVVGLPGDRVRIRRGHLFVNDVLQSGGFDAIPDRASMDEVLVPDDQYFVLGDNRPISCDSREFGLVDQTLLKGKVRMRFWPLDRMAIF